ncbi:hypothetical protein NIES2119_21040 [[Phormidium ambiguum] IAM M-71]|uniref:DUF4278 domain-containing protein n=1 Tax=[Phormidium ambiguum] IAM M-71 TaxID=454136 RepID=A0A1U7IE67_9CYAN|nr:DUF4278 domain-containing protein [Phormidium ambiguum]OKH35256.1 hypothetical protein NIES2119_21040 [Phormidium ambiguum IAM M-71]
MNFTFMIPLSIVLVATYFIRKSEDEIVYLCGIVVVIGLILSLILAPWQIQLLLLIIAGFSTLRLGRKNQTLEIEAENKSSLQYRGSNYESNQSNSANIEVIEADVEGKYRGQVWKNNPTEKPKIPQVFHVTYRGASTQCQKYVVSSEQEKTILPLKLDIDTATNTNQQS